MPASEDVSTEGVASRSDGMSFPMLLAVISSFFKDVKAIGVFSETRVAVI